MRVLNKLIEMQPHPSDKVSQLRFLLIGMLQMSQMHLCVGGEWLHGSPNRQVLLKGGFVNFRRDRRL
jgi:hypothetical protein